MGARVDSAKVASAAHRIAKKPSQAAARAADSTAGRSGSARRPASSERSLECPLGLGLRESED